MKLKLTKIFGGIFFPVFVLAFFFPHQASADITIPFSGFAASVSGQAITGVVLGKAALCNDSGQSVWSSDGFANNCSEPSDYFEFEAVDGFFSLAIGDTSLGMATIGDEVIVENQNLTMHFWFSSGDENSFERIGAVNVATVPRAIDSTYLQGNLAEDFMRWDQSIPYGNIDAFGNGGKTLTLGDSTVNDYATLAVNTAAANDPFIRFNAASGQWEFSNNGTTTTTIGSGSGTGDMTSVIAGNGLTGGAATGDATVDVGAGFGITVAANAVAVDTTAAFSWTSAQILDNALTDNDLNNGSVGSLEIQDNEISSGDIEDNAVLSGDIANDTLTANDFNATLTFALNDLLDLSSSVGDGRGLRLPQTASDYPVNTGNIEGLIFWDTDNDTINVFDGTTWSSIQPGSGSLGSSVDSSEIVDNDITDNDLANGSVGSLEIGDNMITATDIQDNAVSSSEVLENSLTGSDIDESTLILSLGSAQLTDNSITADDIQDNAVGSSEVLENSLTGSDIDESTLILSLGSAQLTDNSITADDIQDNAVGSSEVLENSLTGSDINESTLILILGSAQLTDNSITADDIQDNAVGSSEVLENSLTGSDINESTLILSLGSAQLTDNSITADDIQDNAVASLEIAEDSIGAGDIATGAVTTNEILDSTITANDLNLDMIPAWTNSASYTLTDSESLTITANGSDLAWGGDAALHLNSNPSNAENTSTTLFSLNLSNADDANGEAHQAMIMILDNDATTQDDQVIGIWIEDSNTSTADIDSMIFLNNPDTNNTLIDAIRISGAGTITDAFDASTAIVVNALNVGPNNIVGTTATIDFSSFDVSDNGTIRHGGYHINSPQVYDVTTGGAACVASDIIIPTSSVLFLTTAGVANACITLSETDATSGQRLTIINIDPENDNIDIANVEDQVELNTGTEAVLDRYDTVELIYVSNGGVSAWVQLGVNPNND